MSEQEHLHVLMIHECLTTTLNPFSRVFVDHVALRTSRSYQVLPTSSLRFRSELLLLFKPLPCLELHIVIDGHPIAVIDIDKECELICVVIGDLACVTSFNLIHNLDHPDVLGLPWFELHKIHRRKQATMESNKKNHTSGFLLVLNSSTIEFQQSPYICVFVVVTTLYPSPHTLETIFLTNYQDFANVFELLY